MEAFIVTAALVLILSFLCGSTILFLLKLHKCPWFTFATPIGFCTLMALMQIGDTYLTYTGHYDSTFQTYAMAVIIVILVMSLICFKGIIASFKRLWKYGKWKLPVAILLFAAGIWVYSRVQTNFRLDDINFYGVYIPNRLDSSTLSSISYDYQSYFVFQSVLLKWCRWIIAKYDLGISFLNLGFVEWVPAIITMWVTCFTFVDFFDYLKRRVNHRAMTWVMWVICGVIIFADYWYFAYPHFGGTLRRVMIVLILLIMHSMASEKRTGWKWLASLVFGAAISVNSSSFFLSMMILYAWVIFSMIKKRKGWLKELLIMLFYPALFAVVYMPVLIYVFAAVYIVGILIVVIKKDEAVEHVLNYLGWPILIIVPVGIIVLSQLGYPSEQLIAEQVQGKDFFVEINQFDMVPDLLHFDVTGSKWAWGLFNILFWIASFIAIIISFKKKSWLLSLFMITLVTFFNPFVSNFIGSYLTSVAYFRITDLFFNYVTLAEIMIVLCGLFDKKPVKVLILAVFTFMAILRILSFKITYYVAPGSEADEDYDSTYHASKEQMKVIQEFSDEFLPAYKMCRVESEDEYYTDNVDDGTIKVASQIYGAPLFTEETIINTLGDRYAYVGIDTNEYEKTFARRQPGYDLPDANYQYACTLAINSWTDYVILDAQYNWELQENMWTCASDVMDEGYYRVLMTNNRYWKWNIYQGETQDYTSELNGGN